MCFWWKMCGFFIKFAILRKWLGVSHGRGGNRYEKKARQIAIMGRILAIDYGRKRCGLAVTDPLKLIAHALETVPTAQLEAYLAAYMQREEVETIVVGLPLQMDATPSESSRYIEPFVKRLAKLYPDIPIERVDERFTSKIAFQTMLDVGLKKKKRREKGLVDALSATLILQTYMQNPNKL